MRRPRSPTPLPYTTPFRSTRRQHVPAAVVLPASPRISGATAAYTRRRAAASSPRPYPRSEEHTSELQSRQYLVCRLLLEKKQYLVYRPLLEKKQTYSVPPV